MDDTLIVAGCAIVELGVSADCLLVTLTPHRDELRAIGSPFLGEELLHHVFIEDDPLGLICEALRIDICIGDADDAHRLSSRGEFTADACIAVGGTCLEVPDGSLIGEGLLSLIVDAVGVEDEDLNALDLLLLVSGELAQGSLEGWYLEGELELDLLTLGDAVAHVAVGDAPCGEQSEQQAADEMNGVFSQTCHIVIVVFFLGCWRLAVGFWLCNPL